MATSCNPNYRLIWIILPVFLDSIYAFTVIQHLIQEIERNTKFNVVSRIVSYIWLNTFIPPHLSQIWHNFGRTLNLMFLSISWIFIPFATGAASYLSIIKELLGKETSERAGVKIRRWRKWRLKTVRSVISSVTVIPWGNAPVLWGR